MYTKYNADAIPDVPGIYAWFLPLFETTGKPGLAGILGEAMSFRHYDSNRRAEAEIGMRGKMAWDTFELSVKPVSVLESNSAREEEWETLREKEEWPAFKDALALSSIFSPPLYVDMSLNLARRYHEHCDGKTGFAERYEDWRVRVGGSFKVRNLLFSAVRLPKTSRLLLDKNDKDEGLSLLEFAVMRAVRPRFSQK